MALVTYILLSTLLAGLQGQFQPELLGYNASKAGVVIILELVFLKLGSYFLNISSESQLLDLVAYSGYKFVGVIMTLIVAELVNKGHGHGGWIGWTIFFYCYLANSLFLVSFSSHFWDLLILTRRCQMRSLRYVLLPENSADPRGSMQTNTRTKRNQRTQFLFFYAYVVQLGFMWILS